MKIWDEIFREVHTGPTLKRLNFGPVEKVLSRVKFFVYDSAMADIATEPPNTA